MPAIIPLIIAAVQTAIQEGPQAIQIVKEAKQTFQAMFNAGLITKEVQQACNDHVDACVNAANTGTLPPEFYVEP
jgi:hypothetical protein